MKITNEQIEKLKSEAADHGDHLQVVICDLALSNAAGADKAREICADVVQRAEKEAAFNDQCDRIEAMNRRYTAGYEGDL